MDTNENDKYLEAGYKKMMEIMPAILEAAKEELEKEAKRYSKREVFHIQLKNGHYFDYYPISSVDVKYENERIIIRQNGKFSALYKLSEIAYMSKMEMYFDWDTLRLVSPCLEKVDLEEKAKSGWYSP